MIVDNYYGVISKVFDEYNMIYYFEVLENGCFLLGDGMWMCCIVDILMVVMWLFDINNKIGFVFQYWLDICEVVLVVYIYG